MMEGCAMTDATSLPVVVIGAGPVGLAAAARLLERGMMPMVLERGPKVGAAVRAWGHVRLFSPWRYNIDDAAHGYLPQLAGKPPTRMNFRLAPSSLQNISIRWPARRLSAVICA
jgi:cation diffusion facilitator CzcD-associated flavoprotein CzcO